MEMLRPMDIEKRSFGIIAEEMGEIELDPMQVYIIKRVIHASAFSKMLLKLLLMHKGIPVS